MSAWRGWYQVTGNTYGTWLPGDERGWKTRHGRPQPGADEPPPPHPLGTERLRRHVEQRMLRAPVTLSEHAQRAACEAMVGALHLHQIEVVICGVGAHSFHLVARFVDGRPRHWVGIAKKESARALSRDGLAGEGGVWAVRCHCKPVRDRAQQVLAVRSIESACARGAAVWRRPAGMRGGG